MKKDPNMKRRQDMLLDPQTAMASPQQRRAMAAIMDYVGDDEATTSLQTVVNRTVPIFRGILTQLVAAKGAVRRLPLDGIERGALATEAWAIIQASELFVRDRVAAGELSQEAAEQILDEMQQAQLAAESPDMGEEAPTLALVPDVPADETPAPARVAFDALGAVIVPGDPTSVVAPVEVP